jgi:hypothetical protein
VFVGLIGYVVDSCICGCGFAVYVNLYFVGLSD